MSKIGNNPLLFAIKGKLGNIVFREMRGKMQMVNRPKPREELSEKQQNAVINFKRAIAYAKRQMLSDEMKALYATGVGGSKFTPYMVALTDYLVAPKISSVDTLDYKGEIGDRIGIRASDDFRLTSLEVSIVDAQGKQIEKGAAQLRQDTTDDWTYTVTVAHEPVAGTKLIIVARDTPGNVTVRETVI